MPAMRASGRLATLEFQLTAVDTPRGGSHAHTSTPAPQQQGSIYSDGRKQRSSHKKINGHKALPCICNDARCAEIRDAHLAGHQTVALDRELRRARAQVYALADMVNPGNAGQLTAQRCETILDRHAGQLEYNRQRVMQGQHERQLTERLYIGHFRYECFNRSAGRCSLVHKNTCARDNKKLQHLNPGDVQPPLPSRPFDGEEAIRGQPYDGQSSSPHSRLNVNECLIRECKLCQPPARPRAGATGGHLVTVTPVRPGLAAFASRVVERTMADSTDEEEEQEDDDGDGEQEDGDGEGEGERARERLLDSGSDDIQMMHSAEEEAQGEEAQGEEEEPSAEVMHSAPPPLPLHSKD